MSFESEQEPLVILDIDGVIAPMFTARKDGDFVIPNSSSPWIIPFENKEWLVELEEYCELWWGSSWEEESNLIAQTFLGKNLPYLEFSSMDSSSEWTKMKTMTEFVTANRHRKIIIVDDEMKVQDKVKLESLGANCYIPDMRISLTEADRINIMRMLI